MDQEKSDGTLLIEMGWVMCSDKEIILKNKYLLCKIKAFFSNI